jgi:putative transposase
MLSYNRGRTVVQTTWHDQPYALDADMPDYRRYFLAGGTYFFTVVTASRMPLFRSSRARALLGRMIREVRDETPFETIAIVLLPDHLHAIWALPPGDKAYPARWKAIKARFTSEWLAGGGAEAPVSPGYRVQRRRGVWQPRLIEHTIRDEDDLHAHADYLHYNPVKHRLARSPKRLAVVFLSSVRNFGAL